LFVCFQVVVSRLVAVEEDGETALPPLKKLRRAEARASGAPEGEDEDIEGHPEGRPQEAKVQNFVCGSGLRAL
jgi:hypothetical protein